MLYPSPVENIFVQILCCVMFFPVMLPCPPTLTKIILEICLTAEAIDVQILHINPVIGEQLAFQ
jgi:predicted transporter